MAQALPFRVLCFNGSKALPFLVALLWGVGRSWWVSWGNALQVLLAVVRAGTVRLLPAYPERRIRTHT